MSHASRPVEEGDLRLLSLTRIGLGFLWLYALLQQGTRVWQYDALPTETWEPVHLALLFAGAPGSMAVGLLWWLAVLAGLALILGWRTRWAAGITLAAGLLVTAANLSYGKVTHGSHLVALALLVFSFSDWHLRFSLDRRAGRSGPARATGLPDWPALVVTATMGLWYLSSGLLKWWKEAFLQPGTMSQFLAAKREVLALRGGEQAPWARDAAQYLIDNPGVADLLSWGALLFEIGFIAAALSRRLRLLVFAGAFVFHGAIGVLTNLTFYDRIYILPLLALGPLVDVLRPGSKRLRGWFPKRPVETSTAATWKPTVAATAVTFLVALAADNVLGAGSDLGAVAAAQAGLSVLPDLAQPWLFELAIPVGLVCGAAVALWMARDGLRVVAGRRSLPHVHLLYDGTCGMCQRWVDWTREHGIGTAVTFEPWVPHEHRLILPHVELTWPGGERAPVVAAAAINEVWQRLPGWRNAPWRALSLLYRFNGFSHVEEACYRWVAENRQSPVANKLVPGRRRD